MCSPRACVSQRSFLRSRGASIPSLSIPSYRRCFRTFNFRHQATVLAHPEAKATPSLLRCSFAASTMGAVATIGLPILSIYRVSYDHPEIHNYAAYFFFVFQAAAVFLNTYVTRRILHTSPTPKIFRTTWRIQVVFASLFLIAFILYIPVGLAIVCPFERLTVVKCLTEGLGTDYCATTIGFDATYTKLYDYSNCGAINQLRSAAQLVCILTLVGYALSFATHKDDDAVPALLSAPSPTNV
ncbi:hypothetical protein, variant 3 [Aphanomyces astaci]|uniref:CWH43-like N-terminal domain-containing protein n=1 Tax=Aphanomyces astaci TaxID=112090 RepID=W4FFG1_APHAT|nr:hypothetical protein, variant 2 [Aphanomyces astaci]XP_009844371.1 hypothetical protein, variant 3 [Aphanomyces astaci]ETV66180.1 hypothetical protein, variant 2 [Aphanomyces astaci]ETV66181.1 hypothetical protein, variant 3 [Aphanomyces astaci]|eukprot:XP_009844369.1 hypothetical protein, variant 2 [Aphanomyces astaci]